MPVNSEAFVVMMNAANKEKIGPLLLISIDCPVGNILVLNMQRTQNYSIIYQQSRL